MDPYHRRLVAHPRTSVKNLTVPHGQKSVGMPRRFARRLPLVVGLSVSVLLWTVLRVHYGAFILPAFLFSVEDYDQPKLGIVDMAQEASPSSAGIDRPQWEPGVCNVPEIEFLRRPQLGLTNNIMYTRRCIKPAQSKAVRRSITDMGQPLITNKMAVNLTDCSGIQLPPCEYISLPVPAVYPERRYEHLLFGVASTYERLNASLPDFSHWLSSTGAPLLGIVADADDRNKVNLNLTALEAEYRTRNILATFIAPTIKTRINRADQQGEGPAPVEQHHFLLVRELAALITPGVTRWLAIVDDDTFFPSLHPLDAELSRHDHTQSTWLGALSDSFSSVRSWGYMAYGGAGVFLSPPLASAIAPHAEQCMREATISTGDGILRDCIYTHTRTTLTLIQGLYQHDFRGDPSGFFESGIQPLSLHHWKSWYKAPVAAISRVATLVCGDCLLQRFRFGSDTLLANGYSIAVYKPGVLATLPLERVEGTWAYATEDYDPTYGRLRPKVDSAEKKSYLLRDSVLEEGKRRPLDVGSGSSSGSGSGSKSSSGGAHKVFRQLYVYRTGEDAWEQQFPTGVDEVVELYWEL